LVGHSSQELYTTGAALASIEGQQQLRSGKPAPFHLEQRFLSFPFSLPA
jgi:hypothetical protein